MRRIAAAAFALAAVPASALEIHTVDRVHSTVGFSIRHMVSRVSGSFDDYTLGLTLDRRNPAASSVEFRIKATSINTRDAKRDEHLRRPDFFDVARYPEIVFKSSRIVPRGQDRFDVTGDFTMHGITKSLTLSVAYLGTMKDPSGNEKSGFGIETTINRKDFGIVWNTALDAGAFVLGDDVAVQISLQTTVEAEPAAK